MTTWFITRHPGARQWAREQGLHIDRYASHLDPSLIAAGDTVSGALPVHLAAAVCERGARYLNLTLDLPEHARGRELSSYELTSFKARLEEYRVSRIGAAHGNIPA